jgi:hypothetical protein
MLDTLVCLDTPELRERTIAHMVAQMQSELATAEPGSVEARTTAMLVELMPVYIRCLDRERVVFERDVRARTGDPVNELLEVTTQALVNMLAATLMTMVPCHHRPGPCESCTDVRMAMLRNVMENLFVGVASAVTSPIEVGRNGHLHA